MSEQTRETFEIPVFLVKLARKIKPKSTTGQLQWEAVVKHKGYIFKLVTDGCLDLDENEYYFIQPRHILLENRERRFAIVTFDVIRPLTYDEMIDDTLTRFFSPPENPEKSNGRWESIWLDPDLTVKFVPDRNSQQPTADQPAWNCTISGLLHYNHEHDFAIVSVDLKEAVKLASR